MTYTIEMNVYEPVSPDRSERRRRALVLRLAATRETGELDLTCRMTLLFDFGMSGDAIEEAVARVRASLDGGADV